MDAKVWREEEIHSSKLYMKIPSFDDTAWNVGPRSVIDGRVHVRLTYS